MSSRKSIELSDREITYILKSLRVYREHLLDYDPHDLNDDMADLFIIQSLIKKLNSTKEDP